MIHGTVPDAIVRKSNNDFILTYLDALDKNPELTVKQFLGPLDHLESILKNMGIEIEDVTCEGIEEISGYDRVANIFIEESFKSRGWEKKTPVLNHDVFIYFHVLAGRGSNSKTWFLTNDRSLMRSLPRLGDAQPFCYSVVGLLQSISPFVSAKDVKPFPDVFTHLVTQQLIPRDALYDNQELLLLSSLHDDLQPQHCHLDWTRNAHRASYIASRADACGVYSR